MFKSYQDSSSADQFKGFPNLNFQGSNSAYGFSGVSFWLDAAFGLNTQTNLGAVSRWQQRVGNGTFIQDTAGNQPRFILNDANFNNLPSVEAQDSSRFMLAQAGSGLRYIGNNTIAVVSKVNTQNTVNGIIGINTAAAYDGLADGGTRTNYNGFGTSVSLNMVLQGTTESLNSRIKIITNTNVIVNGVSETTGTNTASVFDYFSLFRIFNSSPGNLIGTIAEIIAFNYSMTSTDAIALSDRINQKYALY
jgi:hypothetical protein